MLLIGLVLLLLLALAWWALRPGPPPLVSGTMPAAVAMLRTAAELPPGEPLVHCLYGDP